MKHTASQILILLLLVTGAPAVASDDAQRAAHLLDYIAVDYREAVREGAVVNQLEYDEMNEFVAVVASLLERLEGDPSGGDLTRLGEAILARASAEQVEAKARALSAAIRSHYDVRVSLTRAPQPLNGAILFAEHCAGCHGAGGRGDGPAGAGLDPAPSDLGDLARMEALSPFTVFSTITYGIEGTGMVGYADALSEQERLDLSFFTAALAYSAETLERGRLLAGRDPARTAAVAPSLDALFERVPSTLSDAEDRAIWAHLLAEPATLVGGELPLEIARARLAQSRGAYHGGDRERALRLAVSAYLDGFEHVEPAVALVDPSLRDETEAELIAFRTLLRSGTAEGDRDAVEDSYHRIVGLLDRSQAALAREGLGVAATFFASFAILAREGLEAILLVAAILAMVSRASVGAAVLARRAVHIGWIGALLGGGLTWWMAQNLIAVSGAQREIVEGLASLLAALVLVWVSYWLFSRLDVEKWQAFLSTRLESAAARGSLWVLGGLAFLAVYREAFETVLFYQALAAQDARPAVLGMGAACAGLLLLVVGVAIVRLGRRLPLRPFFATSSLLLYGFAVVFAGQGIAALQEAGVIPFSPLVSFPRVAWLGIYPTLEGLGLQAMMILLGGAAVPFSGALRSASPAES